MEVGESQPGPSLKEKVAAITKSFTMKNASDRKRKLRAKKNEEAGNPERMICFVKMNGFRVKSTSQKNGNGNQIHAQRAQSCPPASRGSDAFNENIEEMVVDDVPIVKSRASRADYQTSQTTWKNRMEAQDTRWKERRDEIFEESIKSSCINKGALCSLCQNQAFVRCQTCRYHLCSNCDKTIHTKQVTHQRKCEVNNCLSEGFRFEDEDYLDIVEKGQAEDILLEADDFDPALEEEDLIMGDCETDEDDCCDWLNGEDCNFTTEA